MASIFKRLPQNVEGEFFVDSTCIDCDACRQIAPATFRDHGDQSSVYRQPETEEEVFAALKAQVACPTASIGTTAGSKRKENGSVGANAFPAQIAENVYYCGFNAKASFGAWSYLVRREDGEGGGVLVDSPRAALFLFRNIKRMGGARTMFLSHVDDVADHDRYARWLGCERWMHAADGARRLGVEHIVEGDEPVRVDDDLTIIPAPGHTRGSQVLLYRDKFLFTGDHLAWSPARETLTAFRSACWYSWGEQIRSMERLLDYSFEWVLPGHGRIHHDTPEAMRAHLERCIAWMKLVG